MLTGLCANCSLSVYNHCAMALFYQFGASCAAVSTSVACGTPLLGVSPRLVVSNDTTVFFMLARDLLASNSAHYTGTASIDLRRVNPTATQTTAPPPTVAAGAVCPVLNNIDCRSMRYTVHGH